MKQKLSIGPLQKKFFLKYHTHKMKQEVNKEPLQKKILKCREQRMKQNLSNGSLHDVKQSLPKKYNVRKER